MRACLARVSAQIIDFHWAEKLRVDFNVLSPIEIYRVKCYFQQLTDTVRFTGRNYVIFWRVPRNIIHIAGT